MEAEDSASEGAEEQLETALEERFSTGQFIGLSLVLDLLHMNGRDA